MDVKKRTQKIMERCKWNCQLKQHLLLYSFFCMYDYTKFVGSVQYKFISVLSSVNSDCKCCNYLRMS